MSFRLETKSLLLRPMGARHLTPILDLWRQPDVRRHVWGDRVISEERAGLEIARSKESFRNVGFGHWVVRRREKRRVIGSCALLSIADSEQIEIVYCIDPAMRSSGYATQAARAVLAHAFNTLRLPLIHGCCARDNIASLRVLEKAGMRSGRPHPHENCEGAHLSISYEEFQRLESISAPSA